MHAVNEVNETIRIITGDILTTLPSPYTNRIGYTTGTVVSHQYVVGHVNGSGTVYQTPSVLWLKDGMPFRYAPVNIVQGTSGHLTTAISFTFSESDAGVYQCIFNDTAHTVLLITDPIQLLGGGKYSYTVHITTARSCSSCALNSMSLI